MFMSRSNCSSDVLSMDPYSIIPALFTCQQVLMSVQTDRAETTCITIFVLTYLSKVLTVLFHLPKCLFGQILSQSCQLLFQHRFPLTGRQQSSKA